MLLHFTRVAVPVDAEGVHLMMLGKNGNQVFRNPAKPCLHSDIRTEKNFCHLDELVSRNHSAQIKQG